MKQISIPSSISQISGSCFSDCSSLSEFSIYQCNEKRIEYFDDEYLVYKSLPWNEIYDTLIWVNPTIETIIIPSFIKIIKNSACWGNKSLTQISIPSSVLWMVIIFSMDALL